jgi:hypothetical protein
MKLAPRLEQIEKRIKQANTINIVVDRENNEFELIRSDGLPINYKPLQTATLFHNDKNSLVRLNMGPFGSGKSSYCMSEAIFRACSMPKCIDGIRRYRIGVFRNTFAELKSTTLKTWLNWYVNLGIIESHDKPVMEYKHTFSDQDGEVQIELIFIGLDHVKDIGKLRSLEITDVYCNEVSEMQLPIFEVITGRVGRYPDKKICPNVPEGRIWMDSNPPSESHWLYAMFEKYCPERYRIYKQPPAVIKTDAGYVINPAAENLNNLPGGGNYYLNLIVGKEEEYIKVYAMGQYGCVRTDKPVYPQYNDDLHGKATIEVVKEENIQIGLDFGLTPFALVTQCINGQLRCIKEFATDRSYLRELILDDLIPYLNKSHSGQPIDFIVGDPSGIAKRDTDGKDCFELIKECGLIAKPAVTNDIESGIDAVVQFLTKLIQGKPAFIVSKKDCPVLWEGFRGQYHYKTIQTIGETRVRDVPNKLHPYSDGHDALKYICLQIIKETIQKQHDTVPNASIIREIQERSRLKTQIWG